MEILEKNKLIAEFMGYEIFYKPYTKGFIEISETEICNVEDLSYDKCWNWLMPVVEKIESLGYGVTIGLGIFCVIQDDITDEGIEFTKMEETKLLSVYEAVIEFIRWYNNLKQ